MADDADRASDLIDKELVALLSARQESAPPATGWCANCSTPLARPLRFCDADCRDDFERTKKSRRLTGGE